MMHRKFVRLVAVALIVVVLAASCSGGDSSTTDSVAAIADSVAATTGDEQSPIIGAIPTTAPVELEASGDDAADSDEPTDQVDPPLEVEEDDSWEVTVLTVKDDTQIVPTFDGPNGNNIKIFDVNQIDGVQLE